jgi:hypothetical protein
VVTELPYDLILSIMNAINGMPVPPTLWQEARNAEGRVYYYNVQTKATQWAKPLDLMTPAEVSGIVFSLHTFFSDMLATACPIEPAMEGVYC